MKKNFIFIYLVVCQFNRLNVFNCLSLHIENLVPFTVYLLTVFEVYLTRCRVRANLSGYHNIQFSGSQFLNFHFPLKRYNQATLAGENIPVPSGLSKSKILILKYLW